MRQAEYKAAATRRTHAQRQSGDIVLRASGDALNIGPLGVGAGLFAGGLVVAFIEPVALALLVGVAAALAVGAVGEMIERRAQKS